MKWEVKMYVGGTVFTESVHAVNREDAVDTAKNRNCLLYTSPSPRDLSTSRMPSSA